MKKIFAQSKTVIVSNEPTGRVILVYIFLNVNFESLMFVNFR